MDQKLFVYVFTVGILGGAFVLCIPYPSLVGALPAFGLTLGGLFLSYCGGHAATSFIGGMVTKNITPVTGNGSKEGGI